jgi:HAD superfamily hydrolase (TIGR01549 family)
MSGIRAVVFDIGETLVNETRHWSAVARYAGVPELTLMGVLGGLIERREHRSLFGYLQIESIDPNVFGYQIEARDLYPDAIPVLRQLKVHGYKLGATGNQPLGAAAQMAEIGLPLDLIGSSAEWGVSKPDAAFFARIASELDVQPENVLYVGDRLDNDVLPAQEVGMHAVFLRRGPWGFLQATWDEARLARHRVDSLAGVFPIIERINAQAGRVQPAPQHNREADLS